MSLTLGRAACGALLWALVLLPCGAARAWTDARARSADVVVELQPDGWARVSFDVELQVRGGWLEGYEISGLDPDASLDELKPPVLVDAEGNKWSPRARMRRAGRLSLAFARRGAPRRGHYRLRFGYRTRLMPRANEPLPGGGTEVRWTLPAWRTGLDDARLWIWAPSAGATPGLGDGKGEQSTARAFGDQALIGFHRLHLPRATPWTVGIVLPDAPGAGVSEGGAPAPMGGSSRSSLVTRDPAWAGLTAGLLALFAMAHVQRRRAARRDVALVYVLGTRRRALLASAGFFVVAAFGADAVQPWALVAAVSCTLSVRRRAARPLQFGSWRRLGCPDRRAARIDLMRQLLGVVRYPDPLSLLGLSFCAALLGTSLWGEGTDWAPGLPWSAACFALACSLSAARWGAGGALQALSLFRLASGLRLPGVGLSLRGFVPAHGQLSQPRLTVVPRAPVAGLLRLEVCADSSFAGGFVVLASVKVNGAADRWLGELGSSRLQSPGGQRVCHLWRAADRAAVTERLDALLDACAERAHAVILRAA